MPGGDQAPFAMYGKKWDGLLGAILRLRRYLPNDWPEPRPAGHDLYPSLEFLTALYIVFLQDLAWVVSAGGSNGGHSFLLRLWHVHCAPYSFSGSRMPSAWRQRQRIPSPGT